MLWPTSLAYARSGAGQSPPLISLAAIAVSSIALPFIGVPWTPLTTATSTVVTCSIIIVAVRFGLRTKFYSTSRSAPVPLGPFQWSWTATSLTVSAAILLTATLVGIRSPDDISQTYDNLLHLNGIRYITNTQNASPFWISTFVAPDAAPVFYPDLWHATVALIAQLSGAEIPVAVNAFNLVVSTAVWPAGVLLLTRQFVTKSPVSTVSAGVLAAIFPAYPLNMLSYGVVYPYFLGVALLPVTLALFLQLLKLTHDLPVGISPAIFGVFSISLFCVGAAHPASATGFLVLSLPFTLIAFCRRWGGSSWRKRLLMGLLTALYLGAATFIYARLTNSFQWPAQTTRTEAFVQALTGSFLGGGLTITVGILAVLGTVVCLLRRDPRGIAAAAAWLVTSILYISAAGVNAPALRRLTAAWYSDTPRLAALAVIGIIPIAVYGMSWLYDRLRQTQSISKLVAPAVVGALLVASVVSSGYPNFLRVMRLSYDSHSDEYID